MTSFSSLWYGASVAMVYPGFLAPRGPGVGADTDTAVK